MDVEDGERPFDVASDSCGQLRVHLSTDEDSEGEWQTDGSYCYFLSLIHNHTNI